MALQDLINDLANNNTKIDGSHYTVEQLKEIAANASIEVPGAQPGAITLTYSGPLNKIDSWKIAEPMGEASNGQIRTVGQTEASRLIESKEFKEALRIATGDNETLVNQILDGTTTDGIRNPDGLRDTVSQRFITAADGPLVSITPTASDQRIWAQTELDTALNNPKVPTINGIPRADLAKLRADKLASGLDIDAVNKIILDTVNFQSAEQTSFLKFAFDPDGNFIGVDAKQYFSKIGLPTNLTPTLFPNNTTFISPDKWIAENLSAEVLRNAEKANEQLRQYGQERLTLAQAAGDATKIAEAGRYLNKLGLIGDIIGLALVAHDANAAYAEGDTEKVQQILSDWATEFVGGLAGGVAAAQLVSSALAPLYFTGPVGAILAGGLSIAAGIAGGLAGEELAHKIVDFVKSLTELGGELLTPALKFLDRLLSGELHNTLSDNQITMGTNNADTLAGDSNSNHLYGLGGNDTLTGHGGNDILEGGPGDDTYIYHSGDGIDTLIDSDGNGSINYDGAVLTGGKQLGDKRSYQSGDAGSAKHTYVFVTGDVDNGGDLSIDGVILIKNFHNGDLGLNLEPAAPQPNPETGRTINGDLSPVDNDLTEAGVQIDYDELDNVIVSEEAQPGREDELYDSTGNDAINSGGGNDVIDASRGGDDVIDAGAGQDTVYSAEGMDVISGGEDSDILAGGGSDDQLYAGQQSSVAAAIDDGNSQEGAGNKGDWLAGQAGDDTLVGGADNDVLSGGRGSDLLIGGAGDDDILGDSDWVAQDFAWTVTWNDDHSLRVFHPVTGDKTPDDSGADIIYAGTGNDVVFAGPDDDIVFGEDGEDHLTGQEGNDEIFGGTGNDQLWGEEGDDSLDGGVGNDELSGNEGNDRLNGGADNDQLWGKEGDDSLDGGVGNDELSGNEGNDSLNGGDGDDLIGGNEGNDILQGDAGNDKLQGGDGEDSLDGGTGDDYLYGQAGNDTLSGGDGNDELQGGDGNDTLDGGAGADQLFGGAGDDVYVNVSGEDTFNDFQGHNTIQLAQANGIGAGGLSVGYIGDQNQYPVLDIALDNGETLTLQNAFFGDSADIAFADGHEQDLETLVGVSLLTPLTLELDNNGGKVHGGAGGDSLTGGSGDDVLSGANGEDTLYGMAGSDKMLGGAGNDILLGGAGNDVYELGISTGNDRITDIDGDNIIRLAADIDTATLTVEQPAVANANELRIKVNGAEIATITGNLDRYSYELADGSRMTAVEFQQAFKDSPQTLYGDDNDNSLRGGHAADVVDGQGGNDNLWGEAGNDLLLGGLGSDTYHYRLGDGQDLIQEIDNPGTGQSADDRAVFEAGIAVGDVSFSRQADGDLSLTVAGLTDAIIVSGWYNEPGQRVESFVFADGQSVGVETLAALDVTPQRGTAGNDHLNGTDYRDILMADSGDDQLIGKGGNDDLYGESGTDTYFLSLGGGVDQVFEVAGETSIINVANYDLSRLGGTRVGDDLLLGVSDAGDSLTLKNFYMLAHDWQVRDQTHAPRDLTELLAENSAHRADLTEIDRLQQSFIAGLQGKAMGDYQAQGLEPQADGSWQSSLTIRATHQTDHYDRSPDYSGTMPSDSNYYGLNAWGLTIGAFSVLSYSSDEAEMRYSVGGGSFISTKNVQVEWDSPETVSSSQIVSDWTVHYLYTPEEMQKLIESLGADGVANPYVFTEIPKYTHTTTTRSQIATALTVTAADGTGYDINSADPESFFQLGSLPTTLAVMVNSADVEVAIITGGASDNAITLSGGHGVVHAGAGNDKITTDGASLMDGGSGDDLIIGNYDDDLLIGGTDNDVLEGGAGNDWYYFLKDDTGTDLLYDTGVGGGYGGGYGGAVDSNTVVFGEGVNLLNFSFSWNSESLPASSWGYYDDNNLKLFQTLDISWQADSVLRIVMPPEDEDGYYVKTGIDYFEFADGSRMTMAQMLALSGPPPEQHAPVLNLALADQVATEDMPFSYTIPADTFIDQDAGDVLSYSQDAWSPWLNFDPETRTFTGTPGSDAVYPIDITVTATDQFGASVGDSFTLTVNSINRIIGTIGDDTLLGTAAADELLGLSGSDILDGGSGADRLIGGPGDDTLAGGPGSDNYLFGLGSGANTIADRTLPDSGDINTVMIGDGVLPENMVVTGDGSHIILSIANTTDKLTIQWDRQNGYFIQRVVFSDGTVWDAAMLESMLIPPNTAPILINPIPDQTGLRNQSFSFTIPADTFYDADSGDALSYSVSLADGSPLPAWLNFNVSSGTFSGTPGADGAGLFQLIVTATDQGGLSAGGAFKLIISNRIEGTAGDDTIVGTAADDFISAEAGNDVVNGMEGNDVIVGGADSDRLAGGAGDDVFLVDGYDGSVDRYEGDDGSDLIQGGAYDDVIHVHNFSVAYTVEKIDGGLGSNTILGTEYHDVINLSTTELVNIALIDGGAGSDMLTGSAGNDVMVGGEGIDHLAGGAGDDVFLIDGNDVSFDRFEGDDGADRVQGGPVDDVIRVRNFFGIYTVEKIDGGSGANIIAGTQYNDAINLSATELVNIGLIDGGLGNDRLIGSSGNDVIVGGADSDRLVGGAGDDVFQVDGNDSSFDRFEGDDGFDLIQGGAGDDVIRVRNFSGVYTVEKIDGGAGSNSLAGSPVNDVIDLSATELVNIGLIDGGLGNDKLTGSGAGDMFDGGAGSDTLAGGNGNDVYRFGLGSGADVILENDSSSGNIDVLAIAAGIDSSQLWFRHLGDNLEMSIIGTADKVTIKDWYLGQAEHVEQLMTFDGKILRDSQVDALVTAMAEFSPPAIGQTTLPTDYQTTLSPVIAGYWY